MRPRKIRTATFVLALVAVAGGLTLQTAGCSKVGRDYTQGSTGSGSGSGSSGGSCTPGETRACYGGPAGTEGHGICKGGTATCQSDGTLGPCVGDVQPQPSNCNNGKDNDCDGKRDPCALENIWGHAYPDPTFTSSDYVTGLTTDSDGNVIVVGYYSGTIQFGDTPLPVDPNGSEDLYVAKINPAGAVLWSRGFKPPNNQFGSLSPGGVATDSSGNVYVTGSFSGSVQFGSNTYTSTSSGANNDMFLLALKPTGIFNWASTLGNTNTTGLAVAANAAGQPIVALRFDGTLGVGGNSLVSTGSTLALIRFDVFGNPVTGTAYPGSISSASIAVDSTGDIVVAGGFYQSLTFGPTNLTTGGDEDIFVAKVKGAGTPVWAKQFGDVQDDTSYGVALDADDNISLGGTFSGQFSFGSAALTVSSQGALSIFAAKLTGDGDGIWAKGFGNLNQAQAFVAGGNDGSLILGGYFQGTNLDFGGDTFQTSTDGGSPSPLDCFLAKFDKTGKHLGSGQYTGAALPDAQQGILAIAADKAGNTFAAGVTGGGTDFGKGIVGELPDGGPLIYEVFVAEFAP